MHTSSVIKIIILIFIVSLISSCVSTSRFVKTGTYDVKKVPPDFEPSRHILLFAELPRLNKPDERNDMVTNKMDQALKEFYPYKYEIVSLKDILENKTKYGDTSIYKYAVLNTYTIVRNTTTTTTTRTDNTGTHSWSVSPSARTTFIDYAFFNRVTGSEYFASGNSSARINWSVAAFAELIKRANQGKSQ